MPQFTIRAKLTLLGCLAVIGSTALVWLQYHKGEVMIEEQKAIVQNHDTSKMEAALNQLKYAGRSEEGALSTGQIAGMLDEAIKAVKSLHEQAMTSEEEMLSANTNQFLIILLINFLLVLPLVVFLVIAIRRHLSRQESTLYDAGGQLDALNRSQAGIEFNLDGTIITANKNFLDAMGYSLDEIKGKHHSIFVGEEYRKSDDYRRFWDDLRAGKFCADQFIRFGRNNKEIWIQATYNPILDQSGKVYKVVKFAVDVTHRRAETLRSAQIQTSLDCVTSNVMLADETNTVIYMNPAVLAMLKTAESDIRKDLPQFSADKVVGTNIDSFHKNPAHQRGMLAGLPAAKQAGLAGGILLLGWIPCPALQ